ncbi:MAG: hypothetical protein IJ629_00445 [Clostridia bacterium]|nr:hypothetical protein [Clostridia bacterium]
MSLEISELNESEIEDFLNKEKVTVYEKMGDVKDVEEYRKNLDIFLLKYCLNAFKVKYTENELWYMSDYNVKKEFELKIQILNKCNSTRIHFKRLKKEEKEKIKEDEELTIDMQNDFNKVLNNSFKNINKRIHIIEEQYNEDITKTQNLAKNSKNEKVSESDVEKLFEFNTKKSQTIQEINNYCNSIFSNSTYVLKTDNVKQLSKRYSSVIVRTLTENISEINSSIESDDTNKLASIFITAFNKNVRLEKEKAL